MDIAFHYFAVKALAVKAGFDEADAQFIAEYSQMVDEFDYWPVMGCSNMPNYVKQPGFDIVYSELLGLLNPVTTGSLTDGCILVVDYSLLLTNRFQRISLAPFHFIYNDRSEIGTKKYRTYPAVNNDMSPIWSMMKQARDEYQSSLRGETGVYGDNQTFRRKTLMKIGVLLHTFADTYAHQMFSGFNDELNNVDLLFVKNNDTGADETEKYRNMILEFLKGLRPFPKIGHMVIEHVPDLTHLSFGIRYKSGNEWLPYTRSNTAEFMMCCEQIIKYLLSCRGKDMIPESEWADFSSHIRRCFMTDISTCSKEKEMVTILKKVWSDEFRGNFDFNIDKIKSDYVLKTEPLPNDVLLQMQDIPEEIRPVDSIEASEDFYLFNVCAEEVLVNLYGNNPRDRRKDEEMFPT